MLGTKKKEERTSRQKILIAEDDAAGRKMMQMAFMRMHMTNVVTVNDGMEAWEEIKKDPEGFRLIIADWNMPFATGLELLEQVREARIDVPFIMITGRNSAESAIEAKDKGVTAFLPKPYTAQQLVRRISDALGL